MTGSIIAETGITASMAGFLASAYFLTYGIMQLVSGMLIDYFGPRKMLVSFVLVAGLGTILFARAESFTGLVGGRALVGFGTSAIFLGGVKLFSLWFAPPIFARLNGVLIAMGGLGMILGSGLMGYLCASLGWRDTNFNLGIMTLAFTVPIFFIVKDRLPAKNAPGVSSEKGVEEIINPFRAVLIIAKSRHFWLIAGWFCLQFGLCNAAGGLWGGQYLRDVHQLDIISVGNVLNMLGVGTFVGSLANAWCISTFSKSSAKPVMPIAALSYIGLFGSLILWGELFSVPMLCAWFFLLAAFGIGPLFAGFACMAQIFGQKLVGTASGLLNTLPSIVVLLLQTLTGTVLEKIGGIKLQYIAQEYSTAFSMYLIAAALSLLFSIAALRFKEKNRG